MLVERKVLAQFLRFGTVGVLGLFWDTATVYLLRPLVGLATAIFCAYFLAASVNWAMNRLWTFQGAGSHKHIVLQWLHFLAANSLGFVLNRGTVYTLCFTIPLCARYPVLALMAGSVAGMLANFSLSRRLVFREKSPETPAELIHMTIEPLDAFLQRGKPSSPEKH